MLKMNADNAASIVQVIEAAQKMPRDSSMRPGSAEPRHHGLSVGESQRRELADDRHSGPALTDPGENRFRPERSSRLPFG